VHSCENTTHRHEGDMGNWKANAGTILGSKTLDLISLSGPFSIIGRSVILHDLTDNCQFTNSSGNRLAQGVIGIANAAYLPPEVQAVVNASSADSANDASSGEAPTKAVAVITPLSPSMVRGVVTFEQHGDIVVVKAMVSGLLPTHAYGFQVHTYGDMSVPDGTSASGRYNPSNSSQFPVGDLGNICTFYGGYAYYYSTFRSSLTLSGNTSIVGRSVLIHSDGANLGSLIGQGVIGYGSTFTNVTFPSLEILPPSCEGYHGTTSTSTSTSISSSTSASTTSRPTGAPTTRPSTSFSTSGSEPSKRGTSGLSAGAKTAIAFFVIAVVVALVLTALYYNRHKRLPFTRSRYSTNSIDYVAFEDNDMDL
jgi:Cu-Zn family superoxide dismutase